MADNHREPKVRKEKVSGHLRIGDDWNAITIIALSQNNPLKAVAEFVENSIDAKARHITIIRGREKGQHYLKIIDDGAGIPCSEDGVPDFKYVATHICDSIKRRLKAGGALNIQGEFGIGLLSFWTVGERLTVISSGRDGKAYQMLMEKGKPGYRITARPHLVAEAGTQLVISPLLEGNRQITGEKIHRYLASELRDRIRHSGVKIRIVDRVARFEQNVEPRKYEGRFLHDILSIPTPLGDIYTEIYLNENDSANKLSLFRAGTRVLPSLAVLDEFQGEPWNTGYFQGIIDAAFLQLTPGTRDGIIRDEAFAVFCRALGALQEVLLRIVAEQSRVEDEKASQNILRSVQKAFKDAITALPPEEYDWFDVSADRRKKTGALSGEAFAEGDAENIEGKKAPAQKQFFEVAGPLFAARVSPASSLVEVGGTRALTAVGMDRTRRRVDTGLGCSWQMVSGEGSFDKIDGEIVVFQAPVEPGIARVKVTVRQEGQTPVICEAEATLTIVAHLVKSAAKGRGSDSRGLPGYTLESVPGQTWRSRFDPKLNLVVINSGHRDFVFAGAQNARKLRYICRLFAKELVLHNFTGMPVDQLLERMIELSLYTEENLK